MSAISRAISGNGHRILREMQYNSQTMKYIRVLPAELSSPNSVDRVPRAKNVVSPPTLFPFADPSTSCRTQTLPKVSTDFPGFGAQERAQRGKWRKVVEGVCETCGTRFPYERRIYKKNAGRFCSRPCRSLYRRLHDRDGNPFVCLTIARSTTVMHVPRDQRVYLDTSDLPLVKDFWWGARPCHSLTCYAVRTRKTGEPGTTFMHRLILNAPEGALVDHRDGNGLNNRRSNIRLATSSNNSVNRHRGISSASGYRGVALHIQTGKWQAQVAQKGRTFYLGLHETAEAAARAYDKAAVELHGEFARPNFPQGGAS
jgi:hypothetical protein